VPSSCSRRPANNYKQHILKYVIYSRTPMSTWNDVPSAYFAGSQRLVNNLLPAQVYAVDNTQADALTAQQIVNPLSLPYPSVPFVPPTPGQPPSGPPTVPTVLPGMASGTTMTCQFNVGGITGTQPITYQAVWKNNEGSELSPPITATQVLGNLYQATRTTTLFPGEFYTIYSKAVNQYGEQQSVESTFYFTSDGIGTAPSGPPTVPVVSGTPTQTSITVTFDVAGITGTPAPSFNVLVGTTTSPAALFPATLSAGTTYTATATGLDANTFYYFKSLAANGILPNAASAVSAAIKTAGAAPVAPLISMAMVPFLIRGPRFNTPASAVLDWWINCDAVGYLPGPPVVNQTYGSYYAVTQTSNPSLYPFQSGLVIADQTGAPNQATNVYITNLQATGTKVNVSIGGFYADVLGMMGPYSQAGIVAANPSAADLGNSIANIMLGITTATNPLGWAKTNWPTISFDGINFDFENIGQGGNPGASNTYPLPQSPAPEFPTNLNTNIPGTAIPYSTYVTSLKTLLTTIRAAAPNKLITMAPLSASIFSGGLTKNTAVNNALNTWAAFATEATVPTLANYQPATGTGADALLAPAQLALFDDLFVQFYNAPTNIYLGGEDFVNLLAQWGFLCLYTQQVVPTSKNVRVNIGLAKGVDSTAPLTPPFYYPAYQTASPPNPNATEPVGDTFPNIGPTIDAPNLNSALVAANTLLQASGLTGAPSFQISDWCSGIGFWSGPEATAELQQSYDFRTNQTPALPKGGYAYAWTNADYPAENPNWDTGLPIEVIPA